jgi:hypothetical protein
MWLRQHHWQGQWQLQQHIWLWQQRWLWRWQAQEIGDDKGFKYIDDHL